MPPVDLSDIFDKEEITADSLGLDELKLWRNLMNKYMGKITNRANPKSSNIKIASVPPTLLL